MVKVELNSGLATPTFGVKMATLSGGTPLAARKTFAAGLCAMRMSNFANAPALMDLEAGSTWNTNLTELSAETNPGIIPAIWAVENAAIIHKMRAIPLRARIGSDICGALLCSSNVVGGLVFKCLYVPHIYSNNAVYV